MPSDRTSIGDGVISAATGIGDASAALASDINMMSPKTLDTLTAMTSEMTKAPSVMNYLLRCPLSIMNA